jgi:hypothetical protein
MSTINMNDYAVIRVENCEVLAIDSSMALCENVVSGNMQDEDDHIVITRICDLNAECGAAVEAFAAK